MTHHSSFPAQRGLKIPLKTFRARISEEFGSRVSSVSRWAHNAVQYTLTPSTPGGEDGKVVYRYCSTDIVSFDSHTGEATLQSGGYRTLTTRSKMNDALSELHMPFRVYQLRRVWYVYDHRHIVDPEHEYIYADGIRVTADAVTGALNKVQYEKRRRVLDRGINKYLKKVKSVLLDAWPWPGAGDCLICSMVDTGGQSWGDVSGDVGHLRSHIDEGYVHGSLLVNAIKHTGRNPAVWFPMLHAHKDVREMATLVGKYLRAKLYPTIESSMRE